MGINYSDEQQAIVDSSPLQRRKNVIAYSGCGKSTTCIGFAKNRMDKRVLYLSFNKSVALEAQKKFPKENTVCMTLNSLAYRAVGGQFKDRLKPGVESVDFLEVMPAIKNMTKDEKLALAYNAMRTFSSWCASADTAPGFNHIPLQAMDSVSSGEIDPEHVVTGAVEIFNAMLSDSSYPITHDFYLKLYQLQKPRLDFDVIIVDEAQDLNPVLLSILDFQDHAEILKVGDPHQSIYGFRNAVDGLNDPDAVRYYLTTTYRFGQNLADLATTILLKRKGADRPLIGKGEEVIINDVELIEGARPGFSCPVPLNITRTKAGLLQVVMSWIMPSDKAVADGVVPHKRKPEEIGIYLPGGADNYGLRELADLAHLATTGESRGAASAYTSWVEYEAFAETTGCPNLLGNVSLVQRYGGAIKGAAFKLKQQEVRQMHKADLAITTAHRSKGLEADYVMLHSDFPDFSDGELPALDDQEVNLLYVAGTRSKRALLTNHSFSQLISGEPLARLK